VPGVRQLFVLRHAKSSWGDPALSDHDRPLASRGRNASKLLAGHLRRERIEPELVLCSSALRARETLELVDPAGERVIEPELYTATPGSLIERLKQVTEQVASVMVIGHNPTLQRLVLTLVGGDDRVEHRFPAAALATLELDCPWSELGPGRAKLTALVRPKDLAGGRDPDG
jgi:phosphohistidine phosphatase